MRKRLAAGCCATALLFGFTNSSFAEEAPRGSSPADTAATELGAVVVTARRREERLQDVPISVLVASGDQLKARGVEKLEDLRMIAPGVTLEQGNGRSSTLQITIRGQRMYGVVPSQDSPTAFYFADALVQPIQGFNGALHDIENVQVLKGPQGTLFGRNTTGGSLTVAPRRPSRAYEGELTGTVGDYNTLGLKGFVNVPVRDNLLVRFAGYKQDRDGYQKVVTPGSKNLKTDDDHVNDFRLSVVYQPTSNIENYLVMYWGRSDGGQPTPRALSVNPNTAAALFGVSAPFNNYPNLATEVWHPGDDFTKIYTYYRPYEHAKVSGFVENLSVNFGDVQAKNIFAYRNVKTSALMNIGGVDVPYIIAMQGNTSYSWSDELQFEGKSFDGDLTWTGGLYYAQFKTTDYSIGPAFNLTLNPNTINPSLADLKNSAMAAYLQGTYKFDPRLSLTVGGRITRDKRDIVFRHQWFPNTAIKGLGFPDAAPYCNVVGDNGVRLPASNCALAKSASFTEPTWNVSLDYKVSSGTMVYVSQRRGYRSGGYNFRAITAPQRTPFDPETVMDYEVGAKNNFNIGEVPAQLNVTAYLDTYKNLQRSVGMLVPGGIVTSIFNAAEGTAKGFEGDLTLKPVPALTLNASYTYVTFKYNKFPYTIGTTVFDFSDRKLSGVPKHQLTAYADYAHALPDTLGELRLTANFVYSSSTFISDVYQSNAQLSAIYTPQQLARMTPGDAAYKTRPFKLVNLQAKWEGFMGSPVDIGVYVRNVFNAAAMTFTSPNFDSAGVAAAGFAPPRTYGAQVTYRFGGR